MRNTCGIAEEEDCAEGPLVRALSKHSLFDGLVEKGILVVVPDLEMLAQLGDEETIQVDANVTTSEKLQGRC